MLGTNAVYALGDCAVIDGCPLPATAQVASQGGSYLGRLFSKGFDMKGTPGLPPSKRLANSEENTPVDKAQSSYISESMKLGSLGLLVRIG